MEVAENADLVNWRIPGKVFKGLGWSDGSCQRSEQMSDGVELIGYLDISFCLFNRLRCFYHHCATGLNFKKSLSFKDPLVISSGKQT
ncbi:hypothetical protein ACFY5J_22840 [Peribacillus butanolivorans]|uniref:hypothetical protein n=1 Tax=Peribacillus butanolivorans TaxID=421767 RepID=UPI0036BB8EB4